MKIFGKRPKEVARKGEQEAVKSRMEFILALEDWLAAQKLGVIFSGESIADTLRKTRNTPWCSFKSC